MISRVFSNKSAVFGFGLFVYKILRIASEGTNKKIYYLVEDYNDKNYKTVTIDFGDDYHHRTTKCAIF